jgi:hypothetical protein
MTRISPINDSTLKYGSSDAGVTIHTDIPELNEKMEEAAAKLKLKKHYAGKLVWSFDGAHTHTHTNKLTFFRFTT